MRDWVIVVSIVWLMAVAGILLVGRPQFLSYVYAQPAFVDPTPMPGVPGAGWWSGPRVEMPG